MSGYASVVPVVGHLVKYIQRSDAQSKFLHGAH